MPNLRLPFVLILATICALCIQGCGRIPTALTGGPRVTYARPFPPDLHQTEQLNIQARRNNHRITLTNSTTEHFDAGTLWINRRFSHPVQSLDIGQTVTLDLRDFVDEHGEFFRGGGFFATERPADVMLFQLETERDADVVLLGLVSVGQTPN